RFGYDVDRVVTAARKALSKEAQAYWKDAATRRIKPFWFVVIAAVIVAGTWTAYSIVEFRKSQETLESHIREVEKRIVFEKTPALTSIIQDKLQLSLGNYISYLDSVGFPKNVERLTIKVEDTSMMTYYDASNHTISVDPRHMGDDQILFREYTHQALFAARP